jgi:uncharacterized repeat protein (TIGR01451 family)
MTSMAITATRRRVGLPALASIGIILASFLLGAGASRTAAVAQDAQLCERPLDIVMIIDRSGSMALETGGKSRIEWAQQAANNLVDGLDANGGVGAGGLHQVGLTSYGGSTATVNLALGGSSALDAHTAINGLSANGVTPLKQGMAAGLGDMSLGRRTSVDGVLVTHVLIFLSDGRPNPDPGSRPSALEITNFHNAADQVYAVAIGPAGQGGSTSEPDLALMNSIANPSGSSDGAGDFTGGNYRHVLDAQSLPNLFKSMQQELLCGDIQITKTPDPAGRVDPGTQVTYTYNVWNDGDTPLSNVTVEDDTCSPVTYFSGKTGNNLLEKGEIWTYKCTMPLQATTTNEACAQGDFIGGGSDSACADVTVEVVPPSVEQSVAESVAESVAQSVAESVAPPSVEQSVEAGTGTPAASQPDTSLGVLGGGPLPTILFSFVLIASLGTLAFANVRALHRRS